MKKRTVKQSKVISLLLAVMMIVTSLPFAGISALAATSGDFRYITLEDGTAEITGYTGSAETLEIPSTLDGYTVTSIGEHAFYWCKSLTNITIPDSVTSIGEGAFCECDSLTNLTIPNSVTSIGDSAFAWCGSLTSITIPNSVTSIGDYAFQDCDSLTSVTIPDGVTSIGGSAFAYCRSLTSITIPDGVIIIGAYAFCDCTDLTSIIVGENNKNYSSQDGVLFNKEKTELIQYPAGNERTSYSLPASVTSIGDSAFDGCGNLTNITILDSVTSIGAGAFEDCDSLTSVTIPDSVTSIGDNVFDGCGNLTDITIPDSVTSIGEHAFYDCSSLTNITIPDSVTSIGEYAFYYCDSLTSITIPDSVTNIGEYAFYLTGYYYDDSNWKNGVLYIGNYLIEANSDELPLEYSINEGTIAIADFAFSRCDNITSVKIPDSVTSIGYEAFVLCYSLKNIAVDENNKNYSSQDGVLFNKDKTELIQYPIGNERTTYCIPDSVTSIGLDAFNHCKSLTNITMPNSITSIGAMAFGWCDNLTNITLSKNLTNISEYQFYNCDSLTSITIPNGVTSIGNYAFRGCNSLTSMKIPDSVTRIGDGAFNYCDNLTSVDLGNGVTSIGEGAFYWCTSLTSIMIPNSVISIGDAAFRHCTSLTNIIIANSVTSIGDWAFESCYSLTSITIPDSVTSIGDYAFGKSSLVIYGYENSYAQTYAEENGYEFVPLYTYENEESGITVDADKSELPTDTELVVTVKEETEDSVTYDISLQSGSVEVQPTGSVTVKIPVPETMDGESVKVYRVESDGTMTNMNAVYKDGYMVFTTEHFSEYKLTTASGALGDVNGDGNIDPLDVLIVKRYIAEFDDAKLEGDAFARADVSGDGKVDPLDVLFIMQKIAEIIDSFDKIK